MSQDNINSSPSVTLFDKGISLKEVVPLKSDPKRPQLRNFLLTYNADTELIKLIINEYYEDNGFRVRDDLKLSFSIRQENGKWKSMEETLDLFHLLTIDWLEMRLPQTNV